MSQRGKTQYFALAISDKLWDGIKVEGTYAKRYEVQKITSNYDPIPGLPENVIIDGLNFTPPTPAGGGQTVLQYNTAVAAAIATAFASSTKWTVTSSGAVATFTRKDSYGTFDLITVTNINGDATLLYEVTRHLTGTYTGSDTFLKTLQADTQTIVCDTGASYINGVNYDFGLQKSAKLESTADGEEDNNGVKESTIKITAILTGIDGEFANYMNSVIGALSGQKKNVFFIDKINGGIKRVVSVPISLTYNDEGNIKQTITITNADLKGSDSDYIYRCYRI